MPDKRDYYEVLSVERTATVEVIKRSYKKLARANHPDRNPGDDEAAVRFKECAEAYEVLSDGEKRRRYDQFGHEGVQAGGQPFHDPSDLFGEIFGSFFGGGGGRSRGGRGRRGRHVQTSIRLTLAEAAVGLEREVEVSRQVKCTTCNGSGAEPGTEPAACVHCGGSGQVIQAQGFFRVQSTCPTCRGAGTTIRDACTECRGSGKTPERSTLSVKVPAGVDDGMTLCLRGEGDPGRDGGPPGDLYVEVEVEPHPLFQRQETHLICEVPVSYTQAVLGTEIEVPQLDGSSRTITVPPGTQPGETFQLRGEGLPDPRGGPRGHLHVEVRLEVPREVDGEHAKLLRELAELENNQVTPERRSFFETIRSLFSGEDDEPNDAASSGDASQETA